jgi:hypothetical protein
MGNQVQSSFFECIVNVCLGFSRQLETLQTAYHSGYFEWPRDRTGEEVAEALGITQPTFTGHLRAAERKLRAMLFDDATGDRDWRTNVCSDGVVGPLLMLEQFLCSVSTLVTVWNQ